jgi:hypothetical protein
MKRPTVFWRCCAIACRLGLALGDDAPTASVRLATTAIAETTTTSATAARVVETRRKDLFLFMLSPFLPWSERAVRPILRPLERREQA